MNNINRKSALLLIVRLAVAYFFIRWGIMKLGIVSPEMAGFIGWAFHNLGLTFLSPETWVKVLGIWEVLIGLGLILGWFTRTAAVFALIIMLGAMNAKWWNTSAITQDILLALGSLAIIIFTAWQYSLDYRCCKSGSCCGGSCDTNGGKDKYKGKEVVEA
jgi:uncharacterized membrane protein YphA (DoxX/SURF4 family)